jgi:hypothetical protein
MPASESPSEMPEIRPRLAVAGNADEDEAGVDLLELVEAQPPLLERPGPEVLDDGVALGDEVEQELLALLRAEVQGDAALVARDQRPPQRLAVEVLLTPAPHRVRPVRRLDLDDLGAEVGDQPAGEWAREQRSQLDDANPLQRPERPALIGRGLWAGG